MAVTLPPQSSNDVYYKGPEALCRGEYISADASRTRTSFFSEICDLSGNANSRMPFGAHWPQSLWTKCSLNNILKEVMLSEPEAAHVKGFETSVKYFHMCAGKNPDERRSAVLKAIHPLCVEHSS